MKPQKSLRSIQIQMRKRNKITGIAYANQFPGIMTLMLNLQSTEGSKFGQVGHISVPKTRQIIRYRATATFGDRKYSNTLPQKTGEDTKPMGTSYNLDKV